MPLLFRSILAAHMSSLGKHGVVAELSFAKRGQSTPLTAISLSSDQRHAVVGGHGIMKVRMHVLCAPVDASVFGLVRPSQRTINSYLIFAPLSNNIL